jgi:hypothetical protein
MKTAIFIPAESCILGSSDERLSANCALQLEAGSVNSMSTILMPIKARNKMPF